MVTRVKNFRNLFEKVEELDILPKLVYLSPDGSPASKSEDTVRGHIYSLLTAVNRPNALGPISGFGQQTPKAAASLLLRWAEREGAILFPQHFKAWVKARLSQNNTFELNGSEHDIIYDKGSNRIVKITKLDEFEPFVGHFGHERHALKYLLDKVLSNELLRDSIVLHGLLVDPYEGYQIVISQRFVPSAFNQKGYDLNIEDRIIEALEKSGFVQGDNSWDNPEANIRLTDVDPSNVVLSQNGKLVFIDVHVEHLDPSKPIVKERVDSMFA